MACKPRLPSEGRRVPRSSFAAAVFVHLVAEHGMHLPHPLRFSPPLPQQFQHLLVLSLVAAAVGRDL